MFCVGDDNIINIVIISNARSSFIINWFFLLKHFFSKKDCISELFGNKNVIKSIKPIAKTLKTSRLIELDCLVFKKNKDWIMLKDDDKSAHLNSIHPNVIKKNTINFLKGLFRIKFLELGIKLIDLSMLINNP